MEIQSNFVRDEKVLMKQLKRVSKIKIQKNIMREGTTLIKQLKRISRLKIQNSIRKKEKTQEWRKKNHLRNLKE